MCYPSPGPRCSGHTGARLKSLNARLAKVETEMVKCNASITRTLDESEGGPSGLLRKQKRIEKLTSENNKNYENYVKISKDLKDTQTDYDGTPQGQKELNAVIENKDSTSKEIKDAKKRLRQGTLMRSWRMNQKDRLERQKTSNQTVREEKNQKIFLNDPKTITYIGERRKARIVDVAS